MSDWTGAESVSKAWAESPLLTSVQRHRATAWIEKQLQAHQFSVHQQAQPIFDEKPWRMTQTIWGCTCGWVGSEEPMREDQVPGDIHRQHVAEVIASPAPVPVAAPDEEESHG